ncbi:hypothetical protein ABGN05_04405 [Aquibium sp. LZ166]|uniref:NHLP leader peptide family natural product n=1 Tax=Aquibium pacificus TaxID=3153579 RepID=A0ABV3SEC8_9HYPH
MARFKLTSGSEDRDIGKAVLEAAEAAGKNGGKLDDAEKRAFEARIKELIDPTFAGSVEVLYDTPDQIHIVIPYLPDATYSDNNFANEAMGHIVVRGCGR